MAATTIYDVMIRFGVKDKKAKRGILGLGGAADKTYRAMKRIAIVAGAGLGMGALIKHTVGYNRQLDITQKSLATVIDTFQKVGRSEGLERAGVLMGQLRNDAKKSAGTFQDMTDFSKLIAPPLLAAGATMEELREVTKGGVVAASAFGIEAGIAALDIRQALGKGLNKRDPFGSMLLDSVGMTTDAFNKLDKVSRLKTLLKAFDQPSIKAAAKEYETSFEGTFSTFKAGLQEFGGKVGAKLFAKLSKELVKVNKWFTENSQKVDQFANSLADGMVTAFTMAKKVFGFIIEHKDLLLTMAKAFLITKGAKFMAGPFLAFSNHLGANAESLGKSTTALGKFAGGLGRSMQALAAGFAVGTMLDDVLGLSDKIADWAAGTGGGVSVEARRDNSTVEGLIENNNKIAKAIRDKFATDLSKAKQYDEGFGSTQNSNAVGELMEKSNANLFQADRMEKLAAAAKRYNTADTKLLADVMKNGFSMVSAIQEKPMFDITSEKLFNAVSGEGKMIPTSSDKNTPKNKGGRQTINVHMEVASDDPDRFVIGLEDYFERANTNPSQATNPMRK